MKEREGICLICGKPFQTSSPLKIYCCYSCNLRAKNIRSREERILKRGKKPCLSCGKLFDVTRPDKKYCCIKCLHHDYHQTHKVEINKRHVKYTQQRLKTDEEFRKKWSQRAKKRQKSKEKRNKEMLISILGGKCEICKINIRSILAVHHVNPQKNNKPQDTNRYTTYLKQYYHGEPLRLLCFNHHALLHQGKLNGDIKEILFNGEQKNET